MIILCNECCVYNNDKIILVGQINKSHFDSFSKLHISFNHKIIKETNFIRSGSDFFINIFNDELLSLYKKKENLVLDFDFEFVSKDNIKLENKKLNFPFDKWLIDLNQETSCIISTMCFNYNHRLLEWIEYNKKLGFSAVIIFDNGKNKRNYCDDDKKNIENYISTEQVKEKYKDFVFILDFPYTPFSDVPWNSLQRLIFYISSQNFRNKCKFITLIDADEFIYYKKMNIQNIVDYLNTYNITLCIQSNLLTNKENNDYINNNVLKTAKYIGPNKYTKIFLYGKDVTENEFIKSPHKFRKQIVLNKDKIIHYHVWMNKRLKYDKNMEYFDVLEKFLYDSL